MSVAIGMAQPPEGSCVARVEPVQSAAGTTMPPIAAAKGRAICAAVDSSPCITSRFTSRPTNKKKTAISPSSIHKCNGFPNSKAPTRICTGSDKMSR